MVRLLRFHVWWLVWWWIWASSGTSKQDGSAHCCVDSAHSFFLSPFVNLNFVAALCPMAESVPDQPNTWSGGSRAAVPHLDVEVAGAKGCFLRIFQRMFSTTTDEDMRWTLMSFSSVVHIFLQE